MSAAVRAAFDRFDKNRSGFLDYRELRNALQHMGYDVSTRDAMELLRAYDDHDGKLDVHEFGKLVRDLGAVPRPAGRRHAAAGGGGVPGGAAPRAAAAVDRGARARRAARAAGRDRMQQEGMLTVHLKSASGLKAYDMGGSSDPFVTCKVGDKSRTSHVERSTLNPKWDEKLHFTGTLQEMIPHGCLLSLYDHDRNTTNESSASSRSTSRRSRTTTSSSSARSCRRRPDGVLVRWEKTGAASSRRQALRPADGQGAEGDGQARLLPAYAAARRPTLTCPSPTSLLTAEGTPTARPEPPLPALPPLTQHAPLLLLSGSPPPPTRTSS